ncbi:MAG: hypothetical protein RJQ01_11720 [Microcella sp.]|uniref:hypothetical protein n=1 Tax=Microcella sp. TaxID=1913979 RepID=UPI00331626C9
MTDDDRRLRDRLRAADPARDLAPLDPTWLDHRMEHIMTDTTTVAPAASANRAQRLWAPLVGVAAVAAAAAIAVPLALGAGGSPSIEALEQPSGGDLAAGSCPILAPEQLTMQDQAFAARVITVEGGTAVLEVTERFTGEVADRVEVPQVDPLDGDFSGVPFDEGGDYLIAASGGVIALCGLTGDDSSELRAIYEEAFRR